MFPVRGRNEFPCTALRAGFILQPLLSGFSDCPVKDVYRTWEIQFTVEGINNWLLSGITLENKSALCVLNKCFSGITVLGACKILPEDSVVLVVNMAFSIRGSKLGPTHLEGHVFRCSTPSETLSLWDFNLYLQFP